MSCPSLEQLASYQTGLGTPRLRERLEQHLQACAHCRREMLALAKTADLLQAAPVPIMPDDLWSGVAARIRTPRRSWHSMWWKTAAGMGVAASLVVGLFVMNTNNASLPTASPATSAYVVDHQFLSVQDPLADRASLGVMLAAQGGE